MLHNKASSMVSSCKGEIKFWNFLQTYKAFKKMDYRYDVQVKTMQLEEEFSKIPLIIHL